MREILFRGKRTDNGTWTCGYLFCIWERTYLCWGTTNSVPNMEEVLPETVCQFTGLYDKNGRKIFEGDIVGCFLNTQIFEIKYCEERCGYFLDDIMLSGDAPLSIECLGNMRNTVEVIGTIHDHPELLKGGEQ